MQVTAEYLADAVCKVIRDNGLEHKVICVETDTPHVMKKMWRILEERSEGRWLVLPCLCHVLNLMLKVGESGSECTAE